MELSLLAWPEVETYLKKKKTILLPVGSTEQHGPTGLIGTDYLTAFEVAKELGHKTKTLVAPPLCYGMAHHHMAFPGSASLSPSLYIQVLASLIRSFAAHGFSQIYVINGHGGNIPSIQASFSEVLDSDQKLDLRLYNWWHLPSVRELEEQVFGDKNGFHATCGEISLTQFSHPQAFASKRSFRFFKTQAKSVWPLGPKEFRKTFPDGRMGSDPRLARKEHGQALLARAISDIQKMADL